MSIRIIADSTFDIAKRYMGDITLVPMHVRFGDEEYIDGITITKNEFYDKLVETDELPHTSQAVPADFNAIFDDIRGTEDSAIVLTVASKLSGTYQSACLASADDDNITVIDTKNVATGSGILAEYAIDCVKAGMSHDEVVEAVNAKIDDVCLVALLDTLEYLKLGGRISPTVAFAGGLLNIKPVVTVKDGVVEVIGKARGSKQGNNFLNKMSSECGIDYELPILLGYSGVSDQLLQKYIEDSKELWEGKLEELDISQVGSVIGTHAGPGAIVVSFFRKH